jgi:type IV pilus biogenesis protein CpaD/CtpE
MGKVASFMNKLILILPFLLASCTAADLAKPNTNALYTDDSIKNRVGPNGELISPENCPDWTASPITTYGNGKQGNFGCATVTNLGLMLEDPRDLERGASNGAIHPDPQRSSDAIKNYRGALSGPAAEAASGAISMPLSVSGQ